MPPCLETCLRGDAFGLLQALIAKQDCIERVDDLLAVIEGPGKGIGMRERAIFRVRPIRQKPHCEAAGGKVALGRDVIAREGYNRRTLGAFFASTHQARGPLEHRSLIPFRLLGMI